MTDPKIMSRAKEPLVREPRVIFSELSLASLEELVHADCNGSSW
jgi:hypothetical protein